MNLSGVGSVSTATDGNGAFTFTSLANGSYTLTPSLAGYTFTPPAISVVIDNGSVIEQNFVAASLGSGGSWDQKESFPGTTMREPLHFSVGGKGYVGITEYSLAELWEYNPATGAWTRRADLPAGFRFQAPSFVIDDKAYLIVGVSVWQYNPDSDSWTQKNDIPGADKRNTFAFSVDGKGYVGGGSTAKTNFGNMIRTVISGLRGKPFQSSVSGTTIQMCTQWKT